MGLLFWDGVLRGGAIMIFALLALLFARDWNRSLTAKLGVLLTVGGISYLLLVAIPHQFDGSAWRVPLHLISLSTPGLFWLLASSWFDDDFVLRPAHVAAVAASVAAVMIANYYFAKTGVALWPLAAAWQSSSVVFVGMGIIVSLRGRGDDLVEARRRLRLALSIAIALVILVIVLSELLYRGWPPPMGWRLLNASGLFALAVTLAATMLSWRDPALLAPPAKPITRPERVEPDNSALLARLNSEMTRERLYRQDGLTITAVAARLGVPEYRLRRAINQGLGARNFNAYLNGFRLTEARDALGDPQQREVPILTIALDAGFGSIAPFNRAFRAVEGCTPTEYRTKSKAH
jgi:AraC-like DNA-binding protein